MLIIASCNNCGTTILCGGEKEGKYRFCNKTCFDQGRFIVISDQIPFDVVKEQTKLLIKGRAQNATNKMALSIFIPHIEFGLHLCLLLGLTSFKYRVALVILKLNP